MPGFWNLKTDEEVFNTFRVNSLTFIGRFKKFTKLTLFDNIRNIDYSPVLNLKSNIDDRNFVKVQILNKSNFDLKTNTYYRITAKVIPQNIRAYHNSEFLLEFNNDCKFELYTPNEKEFTELVYKKYSEANTANSQDILKSVKTITYQINKRNETFIYELLQNADDYPLPREKVTVNFYITDKYLLFTHSGSEFNFNNVYSLCAVNAEDKVDELNKIGFKGIGFKSVFKANEFVYLKSGNYSFRFEKAYHHAEYPWQLMPIWTEPQDLEVSLRNNSRFLNSNVAIALKPRKPNEVLLEYSETLELFSDERILLFLRNVDKVNVFLTNGKKIFCDRNENKWWLKQFDVAVNQDITDYLNTQISEGNEEIPSKFADLKSCKISFAALIKSGQISLVNDAKLFNYLPLSINLNLGFLINSDFIPDGEREGLISNKWNEFLLIESGKQFIQFIKSTVSDTKRERKFCYSVINMIPSFHSIEIILKSNEKWSSYFQSFRVGFDIVVFGEKAVSFIPNQSGKLESLSNILVDETGIVELLDLDFALLTDRTEKLIHKDVGEGISKVKTLLSEYNLVNNIYSIDTFKSDIQKSNFQEWLKLPSNNFKLIKYLFTTENVELKALLHSEKIVLSQTGELFKAADLFNTIPVEVDFIANNKVEFTLKGLLDKEKIELELKPFNAIEFYKANLKTLNSFLTNENNILNVWSFIYDNWIVFKEDDEIKKSLYQLLILCKPIQEGVLNIKTVSFAYVPKEFAKEDEVETIIATLNLTGKFFIESKFSSAKRPDIKKWNEILKSSRAKSGLKDVITELVTQLPTLDDSLHFKACIEIFKYWKANKEKPETQLTETQKTTIQQTLKLKCAEGYYKANQCIISEYYSGDERINKIMPSIILKNQISSEYQPNQTFVSEWKQFFSFIGCKDLNSEQIIFNYKVDYFIINQDSVQTNHFAIMKDFDLLLQANQNAEVPITFDFANKFAKIKLQTSIQNVWVTPNEIHFSTDYTPELELQSDSEIQSQFKFLSPAYLANTISKDFLIKSGVHNNFCFINITPTTFSFYPSILLTNKKYISKFWSFIIDSEIHLKQFSSSNILSIIKTNNTIEVSENLFKKPTELFSKTLETYVDDKSLIPLIDFSKHFTNDNRTVTLEQLIGINQELSINQCLALLKKSNGLTQNEVSSLKIVTIIQRNQIAGESIVGIKLPNTTYNWLSNTEIYFSQDAEIISQHPNNLLHPDFNIVFSKVGVTKISVSDYKTTYAATENSNAENEIKTKFNSRAEYVAFIIANGEARYSTVAEQLKTFIGKQNYIECDDLYDTIQHGSMIWKRERKFLDANSKIYFTDELASKKSEIRKYLFKCVLQQGKVTEKIFHRYIFDETEIEIIQELNKTYDIPEKWLNKIQENENQFRKEVELFIESLLEVEDIYDEEKVQELKSILADFKNQPDEKRKTFNLLAKLKLCRRLGLSYDSNWDFNKVDNGNEKYFIHSARGSFAYIHPNELLQMRDKGFKMAIDFGTNDIRIYNSPSEIIELYKNYLMLYQGKPSEEDILNLCEDTQDKAKFHFLIVDREKQTNDALTILKILNYDSYE